jgi:hypothetical protein
MVFSEIVRNSLVVKPRSQLFLTISRKAIHWLQRSCERGLTTKEFLTIWLKTIHWLQRSCERGLTTKEFLTITLKNN